MALALLPQTVSAQEPPADPHDACPEDAPESGFTDRDDIPDVHVANVDCAAHFDIVRGFADNTYRPRIQVRRDQMASFIALTLDAADVELPAGDSDTFNDVPDSNVHSDNVNRLAAAGIVEGGPLDLSADEYGPALRTRRDQMASFLMRAAGFALHDDVNAFDSTDQQFTDVPAGNVHFAKVNAAAENDIALGVGDGLYAPRVETRRDQMASFVVRLLNFILDAPPVGPRIDVTLDPTSGEPGTEVTATVTGDVDELDTLAVSGECIDDDDDVALDEDDQFTIEIDEDADVGACVLTFTATFDDESTQELTATFTVVVDEVASFTDAPELIGVELQREFDTTVRYAFEFDVPVSTQGLSADDFFLNAWDGTSVAATSVVRDDRGEDDGFSGLEDTKIRAVFPKQFTRLDDATLPGMEDAAREYFTHLGQWVPDNPTSIAAWGAARRATWLDVTTASVRHGATRLLDNPLLFSPEGAIGIRTVNLDAGRTQWPNLVEVTNFDTVTNRATFVFDRNLSSEEEANVLSAHDHFWLVLQGGTTAELQRTGLFEVQSSAVLNVNGNLVRVEFLDGVHAPDFLTPSVIGAVRRAYVEENAFSGGLIIPEDPYDPGSGVDLDDTISPMTDVDVAGEGLTSRPDLVDYEIRPNPDQVLFVFDEAVEDLTVGPDSTFPSFLFHVQYKNGQTVYGEGLGTRPAPARPEEVLIDFPTGSITEAIVNVGVTAMRQDVGTTTDDLCSDALLVTRTPGLRHFICDGPASDTGNRLWVEPRNLPVAQSFAPLETLAPNLQSVEVLDVGVDPATGEVIERQVTYQFDRRLQIFDAMGTRPGAVTFTLYDEDGARRTARAVAANVTADGDRTTVVFSTTGPAGPGGSTFSLLGAADSVIGGVVFGNELETTGAAPADSGVLGNFPLNVFHAAASRNNDATFGEANDRPAYSLEWITNYETSAEALHN